MNAKRALVMAGGGIRVAWQAGAIQALDEAGLRFDHGDGTSGGIFNLGMLLSGVEPAELGARWRALAVRRFLALQPWRAYLRSPTNWDAFGSAKGVADHVLPALGIDIERIRAATAMTGTFNVADFDTKTCVAIPHDEIDRERLVAGVSLPIFMPAVEAKGTTWTDAVWIKDANLLTAVERGCTELWLLWCIGNTPYWGRGALEQYVHMIELSANGALFSELAQIAAINARRSRGEAVGGTTEPVTVHVVKPERPLPLDPDFVAGRITAETLVAMGYRDASRYLKTRSPQGVALDSSATRMTDPPLGARVTLRAAGTLAGRAVQVTFVVEGVDLARFVTHPSGGTPAVGAVHHADWGYRPFADARFAMHDGGQGGYRVELRGTLAVAGDEHTVELVTSLGRGRGRWASAARWSLTISPAGGAGPEASGAVQTGRRDALRTVLSFEPSGAHDLASRIRAARTTIGFLRRPA